MDGLLRQQQLALTPGRSLLLAAAAKRAGGECAGPSPVLGLLVTLDELLAVLLVHDAHGVVHLGTGRRRAVSRAMRPRTPSQGL